MWKIICSIFFKIFISICIVVCPVLAKWINPSEVKGLDTVAESMINVTSINLGLFAAMIGIVVAFWDKDIFLKIRQSSVAIFEFVALEAMALISNFFLLISSVLVQLIENFNGVLASMILTIWLINIIVMMIFTFESLFVMFKTVIYADNTTQKYEQ